MRLDRPGGIRIGILGETRMPVLPYGPGGLGRATHEIATALAKRGRDVTLYAPGGSVFEGDMRFHFDVNITDWDVLLDYSHDHALSRQYPGEPILNLIGDRECPYTPPNAIVESVFMQGHYPGARIVKAGIGVSEIPYNETPEDYLIFMGLNIGHKQPHVAQEVARNAGKILYTVGPGFNEVDEATKWKLLGGAAAILCPYTIDASPRAPLEAAACGTPTICLDGDGTRDHVVDGMTGFVCKDAAEMTERVKDLGDLKRGNIRLWVKQNHDIDVTIVELEKLLFDVAGCTRW